MTNYYLTNEVPKLPYNISIISEKEVIDYLKLAIHVMLQCEKGISTSRIRWGDPKHHVEFWPDEVAPWELISNPLHKQINKLPLSFVEIGKLAIRRYLTQKSINPDERIDPNSNPENIKKKLKTRGLVPESLQQVNI